MFVISMTVAPFRIAKD